MHSYAIKSNVFVILDKEIVYNTLMDNRHPTPTCERTTPRCACAERAQW